MSEQWTHELVASRFRQAWDTLRRLPKARGPADAMSGWPDTVQDWLTAYGYTEVAVKLPAPRPRSIDAMNEVFGWFQYFNGREEAQAVWLAYGCGLRFARIAVILDIHRDTVRSRVYSGTSRVCSALNSSLMAVS